MSNRKSKKASPNQIINESRQNNNTPKTKMNESVNIKIKNIKEKIRGIKYKEFFSKHNKTLIIAAAALVVAAGAYIVYYSNMPVLKETHSKEIKGVLASYDAELHPFEILSSDRNRLSEAKGKPTSKGDGKTDETKFVVYTFEWFGKPRETILYYDKQQRFTRIKLKIGNESSTTLNEKLTTLLGPPVENNDPTVKGGHAIWVRDSVQYKLIHHGGYATVEMKLSRYENTANLKVGKNPLVIQKLYKQDTNKDQKMESIMLLGNKKDQFSTNYNYLHLILWDGKAYSIRMPANMDGGAYPQLEVKDLDGDGKDEIIVSSDNNDVVKNYNVFKFNGQKLEQTYSGHDEPDVKNKEK
ncbi:MAG: hypothetical protein ACRC76_06180 [Proteocatella sp.]